MIRLKSARQAESLRGKIPDIAIELMMQFSGDICPYYPDGLYSPGNIYDPEIHGYLVIIQDDDDIERDIPEAGERGLLSFIDDDPILLDHVSYVVENKKKVFEAVLAIDTNKVIVFILPESVLIDDRLRQLFEAESQLNM